MNGAVSQPEGSFTVSDVPSGTYYLVVQFMGLLKTAEKSITTSREGEFFTTTRYVNEVDIIMLNVSYTLNDLINKSKFIKSEFGEKEF